MEDTNPNAQAKAIAMKKIARKMSLLMGFTLSLFLSLTGLLHAGKFTLVSWLINFLISFAISLIIGFSVPLKKLSDGFCRLLHLKPRTFLALCAESFVSDLLYTPIITLAMVFFAWFIATRHGAHIPFLPMFLSSLLVCFIVGYVLIMICMPLYLKLLTKNVRPPAQSAPATQGE